MSSNSFSCLLEGGGKQREDVACSESPSVSVSLIDDEAANEELICGRFGQRLSLRFSECEDFEDDLSPETTPQQEEKRKSVHFMPTPEPSPVDRDTDYTVTSPTVQPRMSPIPWNDDTIESTVPRKAGYRVTFEIISAKTVVSKGANLAQAAKKKYVAYTILIKRTPGLETQPGVIERRYSDFLNLYQSLKKRFPNLMNEFPFPKKTLVGNFTPLVITERSVAFQHLLAYCLSIRELRQTPEFGEFLYTRELKEGRRLMKAAQFEEASTIIENGFFIQEKLYLHSGEISLQVLHTICVLVACLNAVDNVTEAQSYAQRAIELVSTTPAYDSSELVVPLIILSIRLFWSMGQDKRGLERKLEQLKAKGINIEKQPTLLELVMQKDFTTVFPH